MLSLETLTHLGVTIHPDGTYSRGNLNNVTYEELMSALQAFCPHNSEIAIALSIIELGGEKLIPADTPGVCRSESEWWEDAMPAIKLMKIGLDILQP